MTAFQTLAILLTFAALGSYINDRFLRQPTSVGMMLFTLFLSWTVMGCARLGLIDLTPFRDFVSHIDFSNILLHGMLSFLLFAGALQIDVSELRKYKTIVSIMASIGVIIATFATGTLVWLVARPLGMNVNYIEALMFGALIAPTDPVAVLGILKNAQIAKSLSIKIASESLLNDGVGVALFLILLNLNTPGMSTVPTWQSTGLMIAQMGGGSIVLGIAMGYIAYEMLRSVDDYKTEILVTLALATGGYCFAEAMQVSAPLAMVIAGLIIGHHGRASALTDAGRKHVDMFWELLDDIINGVLFILIGMEMMVVPMDGLHLAIGLCGVIATLLGRFISVAVPITAMRPHFSFQNHIIPLMTWGGLRGGISIAMALSLPPSPARNLIIGMTYMTVVFSVLFQGTTFKYLVKRLSQKN